MLKQFYCRLSTATLLTLMLVLYYHLEALTDNPSNKKKNFVIEEKISWLLGTTEKAMKLFQLNQTESYACYQAPLK